MNVSSVKTEMGNLHMHLPQIHISLNEFMKALAL